MGSGADLRTCLILGFLLSSHDMVTLVMHIKDDRIRNAALLRYTSSLQCYSVLSDILVKNE